MELRIHLRCGNNTECCTYTPFFQIGHLESRKHKRYAEYTSKEEDGVGSPEVHAGCQLKPIKPFKPIL